jgi:hypothetical protein
LLKTPSLNDSQKRELIFCLAAYNMAPELRRCVESIKPYADRIIVVEGRFGKHWRTGEKFKSPHSTDGTAQVAEELGCEVILSQDLPQHEQRDLYLKGREGDVYFIIDADMTLEGVLPKQQMLYGKENVWAFWVTDPDGYRYIMVLANRHIGPKVTHNTGQLRVDGYGRLMDGTYPGAVTLTACSVRHHNIRGHS